MPSVEVEQRAHQRRPHKQCLEIRLQSRSQHDTLLAISSDISESGVCIFTFKPLKEGDGLLFTGHLPVPYNKATVRWVKQCKRSFYKVGALFAS